MAEKMSSWGEDPKGEKVRHGRFPRPAATRNFAMLNLRGFRGLEVWTSATTLHGSSRSSRVMNASKPAAGFFGVGQEHPSREHEPCCASRNTIFTKSLLILEAAVVEGIRRAAGGVSEWQGKEGL